MVDSLRKRAESLLKEGNQIKNSEGRYSDLGGFTVSGPKTKKWMNDVALFASKLPTGYPIRKEIESTYFHRSRASAFSNMISYLESIITDSDLEDSKSVSSKSSMNNQTKEYDVFISHANKDKIIYVDALYEAISDLGVKIFYDKNEISWGDNWKRRILEGTAKSEFAIIVISDNFFGREWTERELSEFLKQQNSTGQKIILPLLFNVSREKLLEHYPSLEEIQYVSSDERSVEEICILFAKELIKRIKGQ